MKQIKTIEDLRPDPENLNQGTPRGHGIIEHSIRQRGAGRSGLAARDGTMVAGNQTLQKMAELGIPVRPVHTDGSEWVVVIRDDLEPGSEEAKLLSLEDNRATEVGLSWSPDVLASLSEEMDLSHLFHPDELAALLEATQVEPGAGGDEFDATPAVDGPTRTNAGELWEIKGAGLTHRLLVGDCTDPANVERLMDGERAALCFTPPPYNAGGEFTGAYRNSPVGRTDRNPHYNHGLDDMTKDEYILFLLSVFAVLASAVSDDSPILWNVAYNAKSRDAYGRAVFHPENPFCVQETIVWDKGNGFNIASKGILSRTCELVFLMSKGRDYFTNQGDNEPWFNVWRISNHSNDLSFDEHGASFPVQLPMEGLNRFSPRGAIVLDPFLGSGTTLIAAHRTGRRCYGIEISCRYSDVVLKRAEAEGLHCELVERISD